jgi:division protein CdvB (Snf7/Vps24/ESCRT-III family)
LVDDFVKGWQQKQGDPRSAVLEALVPGPPVRERITKTIVKLNTVQRRLEDSATRMKAKDKALFLKCVKAQEAKDTYASTMYANEIAQVRKMTQIIVSSQLAMEQVTLRLETVRDFGDITTEILPVAQIIRTIANRVSGVLPNVSHMLSDVCGTMDSLIIDAGQVTSSSYHTVTSGDAEKILAEATAVAEQNVKDTFPTLPSSSLTETGFKLPE